MGKKSIFSAGSRLSFRGRGNAEVAHQVQEPSVTSRGGAKQAPVAVAGAAASMEQIEFNLSIPDGDLNAANQNSSTETAANSLLQQHGSLLDSMSVLSLDNSEADEPLTGNASDRDMWCSGPVKDIVRADGGLYRGQVNSDNLPHGQGRDYSPDGFMFYDGMYQNGAPNGTGTFRWQDGTEYYGQFKDGEPHGMGEEKRADGTTYTGEWNMGVEHGIGVQRTPSGSEYKGVWVQGRPNVEGTESRKCFWYKGAWDNGIKQGNGRGVWSYPDAPKAIYIGQWRNNLPRGVGEFLLENGTMSLRGEFRCFNNHAEDAPYSPVIESESPLIVRFALPDGTAFKGTLIDPISSPPEGRFEDQVAASMAGAMVEQRRSTKLEKLRRMSLFRRKSKSTTLLNP